MSIDLKRLQINETRFLDTFKHSSSIGATAKGGLHRLALSQEDKEMRDVFVAWMKEAGLNVRVDDFGNIYGRREGKIKDAPVVAIGSHLDTQPTGGRFDGILGVLAALEVVRVLNDHQIETDYPIEIVNFTNEEGARFGPPMLGSGGLTEVFTQEFVYQSTDENGVTYKEALEEIGYLGKVENRLSHAKNFVELHIEQGPVLEEKDLTIGIVEGIQGMSWLKVNITGKNSHAGPTPMESRKDALVVAAKMIVAANEITKQYKGLLTTVGKITNYPNVENIVPGEVEIKIDIRHPDDNVRKQATEQLIEQYSAIAHNHKVEMTCTTEWDSTATIFADEVIEAVESACETLEYSSLKMFSGAGHDAKYMNEITKTGMIFVKSIDGISHNEAELTLDEDLVKGANVLLHVVLQLANNK